MSRRLTVALLTTLAAALPLAAGTDDACTRESMPRVPQTEAAVQSNVAVQSEVHATIDAIFAATDTPSIDTGNGVIAEMPSVEMLVARIDAEGNIVLGCVDTPAAAKSFLAVPQAQRTPTKVEAEK